MGISVSRMLEGEFLKIIKSWPDAVWDFLIKRTGFRLRLHRQAAAEPGTAGYHSSTGEHAL